jgi:O-acetylserine/cysteine efflux transporter
MSFKDSALAIAVMMIWGFNFVVIKIGLDSFPPLLFSALRFAFAAFPLVLLIEKPTVPWRYILQIGLALGVAKFGLLFIGMSDQNQWSGMPAGLASLVLQTQAFFTVLFATVLLNEKPRFNQILGIIVAFAGVALLGSQTDQLGSIQSLILVIAAAAFWGISNVLMKQAKTPDFFRLIVWVSLIPPLPLFLLSWLFEGKDRIINAFTHINGQGVSALAYISFLSTIIGFGIWGSLLKRYEASLVAPCTLLVPVFGIISAAIVLNEKLTVIQGIAVFFVFCGLVLNLWRDSKTALKANNHERN